MDDPQSQPPADPANGNGPDRPESSPAQTAATPDGDRTRSTIGGDDGTGAPPRQTVRSDDWLLRGYDGREDGASIPSPPGAGGQLPPPIGLTVDDHAPASPPTPPATPSASSYVAPRGGTPYHTPDAPPPVAPTAAPAPAFQTRMVGPTWQMVVASLIAIIYGVWYGIEGLVLAINENAMAEFYQQWRAMVPDTSLSPDQMPIILLLLYGTVALLYSIGARFLLQFSNAARMLLITLGWVNIALFIRMATGGGDVGPWIDNLIVGVFLVFLLASPDVRRRVRMKGMVVVRGPGTPTGTGAPTEPTPTGVAPAAATGSATPSAPAPYPLRLSVHLDPRPWGGTSLRRLGKPVPDGTAIGESWEVSGHPHAESRVENGPLAGRPLNEVVQLWGEWLLGPGRQPTPVRVTDDRGERWDWRFPLLAKFLDTTSTLSVQVHPPDTADGPGKAEAWVVLHAGDDAFVYQGFDHSVTPGTVRQAIADGSLPELLHKVPVHDGDVIYNPPGVIHAIGPHVRLYEIQQVSDETYRLWDFDRTDRELHVDQALQVMRFEAGVPDRPDPASLPRPRLGISGGETEELVACPHFRTWRVVLPVHTDAANTSCRLGGDVVALVHHVAGSSVHAAFAHHGDEFLKLGESMVIPAAVLAAGVRFTPQDASAGATTLLVSTL